MENSSLDDNIAPQPSFTQGQDNGENLRDTRDIDVAPSKPAKPHIPASASFGQGTPDGNLVSPDTMNMSQLEENEDVFSAATAACIEDCKTLPKMGLRKKYREEANSHRNMLQREKDLGREIDPRFRSFREFLMHVGPKPTKSATLDRIDNNDREYAPDKVRWADKRTQNNNKGDTLIFGDPRTGKHYTASKLAKLQRVSQGSIRKRRDRGWDDEEIIAGERRRYSPAPVIEAKAAPSKPALEAQLDVTWDQVMTAAYPGEFNELTPAERGILRSFSAYLSNACLLDSTEEILEYAIRNWSSVTSMAEKRDGAFNTPDRPSPPFLMKHARTTVQVWLDGNDLEIKECRPQPIPPKPPMVERKEPPMHVRRPEWDKGTWGDVLPDPYEDYCKLFGPQSREDHARHVMSVWEANGSKIVRDMPQWAIDIISDHEPAFAERLHALRNPPPQPEVSEPPSPQPEVPIDPRPDYDL